MNEDGKTAAGPAPSKRRARGLVEGTIEAIPSRGITLETAQRFKYKVSSDRRFQVAPYYAKGELVAQHLRRKNKADGMPWAGDNKHPDLEMFGEHTWGNGGKMVVITEGELDAMSVSQAQGNRWAVGSIWEGSQAAAKNISKRLHTLSKFEKIILMMDDDEAGRQAAQEAAAVVPVGKAYIATIPGYKDANEALLAGREDLIVKAIWEAQAWRPDGLVTGKSIKGRIMAKPTMGLGWFDPRLDSLTFGRHPDKGQVWVIGAGVGVGKTAWLIRQLHYDLMVLKVPVGGFFLETDTAELYQRIAAVELKYPYHLPLADDFIPEGSPGRDDDMMWGLIERLEDRFATYDSFGSADLDVVVANTRYMAAAGKRVFYLDNLTQLTDESRMRESVEEAVRRLKSLADELKVTFMVASHLATPEKGSHEEGAAVALRQFYGSRKLPAWVDGAIGLERDTVNTDPAVKRTTIARLLKVRMNGSAVGERTGYIYDSAMDAVRVDVDAVRRFDARNDKSGVTQDFDDPDTTF